jgi:hypothetical protein
LLTPAGADADRNQHKEQREGGAALIHQSENQNSIQGVGSFGNESVISVSA